MRMEARLKEDIMRARFEEIYSRHQKKELSCLEASDILGMSERSFLRHRRRYEEDGFSGRFDRRLDSKPRNKAGDEEVEGSCRKFN